MVNKTNFYEVVVKRVQWFHFPIAVANGVSKEDAMSAIDDFELEYHIENECMDAETSVELIDFLDTNSKWSHYKVSEETFKKMNYSTQGALVVYLSKDDNGNKEVMTEEYQTVTHSPLIFGGELSKSIE
jgi:coenzyme F420-reducing hydrogenase beta subunit